MNCAGKVTHFVTLIERYLRPASVVIRSRASPATSSREELKNPANPVVPAGALQVCCQEILQRTAAGEVAIDHRVMCRVGLTFGGSSCSILDGSRHVNILKGDIGQAALP